MSLFVTGTDTGVGKTHTVTRLLHLLRAAGVRCAGMKPICCGNRRDAELLLAASGDGLTIDEVNPVWLKEPAAPLSAAMMERTMIDPSRLVDGLEKLRARFDVVLVEGVGGWLVPIGEHYFVSDLAVEMNLPVLVVALNRLGCLNHTMLTVRSVQAHALPCRGVLLNSPGGATDPATSTNADVLGTILDVPLLPELPSDRGELTPEWRAAIGV